jgi:flagellar hook protein FlgE
MFSGVAGLRNHQVKMDVLANNIANVNTYGFKSSRTAFAEMFNQTLSSASAPSAAGTIGGVNPKQIGLGVKVASIDVMHQQGATQSTDRGLDCVINGEGFFPVKQGSSTFYTRAGNLYMDPYGYIVNPAGLYLQGIMLISDGDLPETMEESTIERITSDETIIWGEGKDGGGEQLTGLMGEDSTFPLYVNGTEGQEELAGIVGRIVIPTAYKNISIDQNGLIMAEDETGMLVQVAVLTTVTFINPGGLERVSDNLYRESANSGLPAYAIPGQAGVTNGTLTSGALEMSNVDLSKEFTDMIITQRGFQANSRIITVSDTLLEELVNLKR